MKHPYNFGPQPNFENIPPRLRQGYWCVWKATPKTNGKFNKIPFNGIAPLDTTEPDTWLTFDAAMKLYCQGGFNGIGRLMEKDGLVGLDIDDSKALPDEIKAIGTTYTEKSPSGRGLRLVYEADTIPERDLSSPYEMYAGNSDRFLTFTGNIVSGLTEIRKVNGQLAKLVDPSSNTQADPFVGAEGYGASIDEVNELLEYIDADIEHTWIQVGMAIYHHTNGSQAGFEVWDQWSRTSEKYAENEGSRSTEALWERFGRTDADRRLGVGTIAELAKQSGADLARIAKNHQEQFEDYVVEQVDEGLFSCADSISDQMLSQTWQVEEILEKGSIAQLFGPSYTGKSFLTLYMAACMASGSEFAGKRTIKSRVLYVYGEGDHGIKRRIQAIKHKYPDMDLDNLFYSSKIPNLMDDNKVLEFGKQLKKFGGVDVIIFDTLARAMAGGDENSSKDFSKVHDHLDKFRKHLSCSILVVHHTGHGNTDRGRGSSAHYAAMDNEIKVEKNDDGSITMEPSKAKDSIEYKPIHFRFEPVYFDVHDNFGNQIHSAAVEFLPDYVPGNSRKGKLSPAGKFVFDTFIELSEQEENHCQTPLDFTEKMGLDAPAFGIASVTLRELFDRKCDDGVTLAATIRKKWGRGLQDAENKGYLAQLDGVVVKL